MQTKHTFKIGDKVREISTGDIGVVLDRPTWLTNSGSIMVNWLTGEDAGYNLHIGIDKIELAEAGEVSKEKTEEFTAHTARQLTNEVLQAETKAEFDEVIKEIKAACELGAYIVRVPKLKAMTIKRLYDKGFKCVDNGFVADSIISWEI